MVDLDGLRPCRSADPDAELAPWARMQLGRLGAGNGRIHSTTVAPPAGGRRPDPDWLSPIRPSRTAPGSSCRPARCDVLPERGRRQVATAPARRDVGSLTADGQMMLLPNGVLWIGGNRVYFGEGLSGWLRKARLAADDRLAGNAGIRPCPRAPSRHDDGHAEPTTSAPARDPSSPHADARCPARPPRPEAGTDRPDGAVR